MATTPRWPSNPSSTLASWAGDAAYKQGKSLHRRHRVHALGRTEEQELVAWVLDEERFATAVWMEEDESVSECTCARESCPHAVAVLLAFLEMQERKVSVPKVGHRDERLLLLDELMDIRFDGDKELAALPETEASSPLVAQGGPKGVVSADNLEELIQDLDEREARKLLTDLTAIPAAQKHIHRYLLDRQEALNKEVATALAAIGCAYEKKTAFEALDAQGLEVFLEIAKRLQESGEYGPLLELGLEWVRRSNRQVDTSWGEALKIEEQCLDLLLESARKVNWPRLQTALWVLELLLHPKLGKRAAFEQILAEQALEQREWREIAATMRSWKGREEPQSIHAGYLQRLRWVHLRSGEPKKLQGVLEWELQERGKALPLISWLTDQGQYDAAERHCVAALHHARKSANWSDARLLHDQLERLYELSESWAELAALTVESYLARSWELSYEQVRTRCSKAAQWGLVRLWILHYLETGDLPSKKRKIRYQGAMKNWPLPEIEIDDLDEDFPKYPWLMEIALLEQRLDDLLELYEAAQKTDKVDATLAGRVADAMATKYPMKSIKIWTEQAETLLKDEEPPRYASATRYLRKVMKAYIRQGKRAVWEAYCGALIEEMHQDRRVQNELLKLQ